MSSPTPPSPDGPSQPSQPYDPWGTPHGSAAGPEERSITGPEELRDLARVATLVTVSGLLLGLLWWWLAPGVFYISDGERAFLRNSEGEESVGVDGVFTLLSAGLGLVSGVAAFLWRRQGGIGVVIGLALGSTLASLVGWQLGSLLGPSGDLSARAGQAGRGGSFQGPLELDATIALLVWPFVALLAHLLLTAAFGPRDPEPKETEFTGWGTPPEAAGAAPPGFAEPHPGGAPDDQPGRHERRSGRQGPSGPGSPEGRGGG